MGNTAALVAEHVRASGARFVFAYPGDPIIELMEAMRALDVEVVLGSREGTAVFMAEAHAMVTGRPGVCLSTLGPGSTSIVNGVAAATWDRVPLLAISGQIDAGREDLVTHQVVDHKLLFSPVAKWAGRIHPRSVDAVLRKALRLAVAERPGAVHLTGSAETFAAPAPDVAVKSPPLDGASGGVRVQRAAGGPDPAALLRAARRPVLLAGAAATRCDATEALTRLAESGGFPVVVSPMAKGVFPEDHPLFAGVLDMACNQVLWDFLADSDLVVAAGFDPVELIRPWSLAVPVLHVDTTPNVDQVYPSDCEVVGDVSASLDWLAHGLRGEPRWRERDIAAHRERLRAAYYSGRVPGRLNPTDVIDVVRAAAPPETVVTCDVGSHKLLVGQGWRARRPRSVLMSNGLSSMGFGLPGAVGAQLALGDVPVVALVGDGGFAMAATELRLAAARQLPLTVVVFVDGSLNRIELKQRALGYPGTATRLDDIDLVALAGSMGCDGVRVSSVAELEKATAGLGAPTGPLLIEARIEPAQYEAQF
ncbi:thiamine pyrophosphate-binding protein [Streptomyces cylindrosporus]|uniref:Thiamine pyrophosphate-binding protein n=1 Tax=Streptomyces cylindrosporus TaxID=2927583 RepID=A0ABS9YDK0_9ACTN|nr:thiamine pyrophosphate-binding protein [Streptomyces cylindrosporus]MCI3275302.1 thiamine pyrophosphate-binding protein [Streptomyces cylindrosporus]